MSDGSAAAPAEAGAEALADRNARAARVAGLIGHDGRVTHLQLPTEDAGSWRRRVLTLTPAREHGGATLMVLDAGTRAGAARVLGSELAEDAAVVMVDLTAADRSSAAGLSELLSGDAGFSEIINRDADSNLHLIGAGRAGREAVISAPDLLGLALTALSDAYDIVLVEASTRDMHRFGDALTGHVDASVILADQVSNGHAVETAYKLTEGSERPVAIAVFAEGARAGLMPDIKEPTPA